ncbi:pyridoxamine 5'-phosphate oxidase family protein [Jannaschia seohaensis]|uniref:General stress protein 26 n=1 Tax=Jannaschia seohaensis TaxID=475081 RepID=A0A2Y9A2H3_9RHOB|nr:pyridoxamine 5'-phosphate oxidase family protein [Jannaschia seohaensis]PWJ22362.1 general stress protein 26 [Jannaschia seohaensis]SSA38640.1 General stress protein 26 [Jannaschia seohaensis]
MTPQELEQKFWSHLESDRTVFLATEGAKPRPMHAAFEGKAAPIWFFTSYDTELGEVLKQGPREATMTFAAKGHDFWASASGQLTLDNDKAVIDRLWSPFVAAWYDGKTDPKLALARYDIREAHLWEDGSSLVAGIQSLLGRDPKESAEDKTGHIRMAG